MLAVHNITKSFGTHTVLSGVTLDAGAGEIVGLVGRSGSGKSTVARCILGLDRPDGGDIRWDGVSLLDRTAMRRARRSIQAVFQDPRASLDPRWTVTHILAEPLDNWLGREEALARRRRLARLLDMVSLSEDLLHRHPHELSTGQCQRVCIARALACEPRLIVLDEPLSALDVSVQAHLIDLLMNVHRTAGIGYLLITHDFAVVEDMCDRLVVLQQGSVVESGPTGTILANPSHPHTQALVGDASL